LTAGEEKGDEGEEEEDGIEGSDTTKFPFRKSTKPTKSDMRAWYFISNPRTLLSTEVTPSSHYTP